MAGPQSGAIVAVEVLIEQHQVAPVRVVAKLVRAAVYRPMTVLVLEKDPRKTPSDLLGNLVERHQVAGSGRTFDLEVVAVIAVILQQGSDDEPIDGHPDGSAPVRVAA